MGIIGCGCCLFKSIAVLLLLFVGASFFLGPGLRMQPRRYSPPPSPEFHGPFTVNRSLDAAQSIFERSLPGPESLVIKDGVVYTGLADGRIMRIKDGKLETLTVIGGKDCKRSMKGEESKLCGRPLGMRMDQAGDLVIADQVKGLYKVSTKTGQVTFLVPSSVIIDGKRLNIANDLTISSAGDIYVTDSGTRWPSKKWGAEAGLLDSVEASPSGRIIHYDPKTNKARTLIENVYNPNGIQLSSKEDFLMFSQSTRFNIMKYHLQGLKKGQLEKLVDNLPGFPDNIRPSGRNTYWVALFGIRIPGQESYFERTLPSPLERRIVYSCLTFSIQATEYVKQYFPFPILDVFLQELRKLFWASMGDTSYGLVFEMKEDGTILRSLHSPKGRLNQISQVTEYNDILYFSSFNDFIGKMKLYK